MRERRPEAAAGPVLIAIDHAFVASEADGVAQAVYDALGALDATCPAAIVAIATADLATLVAAARDAEPAAERDALQGAARRVGHVLERAAARQQTRRREERFVRGRAVHGQDGEAALALGADVR